MAYKVKQFIGKTYNLKKMTKSDLALAWKISKEQGAKKEMERIIKEYKKRK